MTRTQSPAPANVVASTRPLRAASGTTVSPVVNVPVPTPPSNRLQQNQRVKFGSCLSPNASRTPLPVLAHDHSEPVRQLLELSGQRCAFYANPMEFLSPLLQTLAARRSGWQQDETGTVTIF